MHEMDSYGLSLVLLRPLAQSIGRVGGDPARFLADLGIDVATSEDAYVDASRVDRVLDELSVQRGDPTFGLTLARTAVTSPLGFFDQLVWQGATVRDALARSARFYALLTRRSSLVIEEVEGDAIATIRQHVPAAAPRGTVLTELAFGSLVLRARQAAGALVVRVMRFVHDATPEAAASYEGVFEAPVLFGQRTDALEVHVSELDRPLGTADPITAAALEAQAVRMSEALTPVDSFLDSVSRAILRSLRGQSTALADLARELRLSERTVQRRLREHGTSLRILVDDVRKEVATRRFREGASTTEVAYELGFARPQAFHKAFVRWTGTTPGVFRARQRMANERGTNGAWNAEGYS